MKLSLCSQKKKRTAQRQDWVRAGWGAQKGKKRSGGRREKDWFPWRLKTKREPDTWRKGLKCNRTSSKVIHTTAFRQVDKHPGRENKRWLTAQESQPRTHCPPGVPGILTPYLPMGQPHGSETQVCVRGNGLSHCQRWWRSIRVSCARPNREPSHIFLKRKPHGKVDSQTEYVNFE